MMGSLLSLLPLLLIVFLAGICVGVMIVLREVVRSKRDRRAGARWWWEIV